MRSAPVFLRELDQAGISSRKAFDSGVSARGAALSDNWLVASLILEVMLISLALALLISTIEDEVPALNWIICTG